MKIDHMAIGVKDLEAMKMFYINYFGAVSNIKYRNEVKGLETYFISFEDGARLELMQMPGTHILTDKHNRNYEGYCHLSFSLGARADVDRLTTRLKQDGYPVIDGPRTTGDGYYESVVVDPEGNKIELTV